ncbi:MAG TPA: alpha/beta fold hydrolase [Polyangiales bacterium]|nr:alpha/beta fold hydrolase [Polyangiales bacterium]
MSQENDVIQRARFEPAPEFGGELYVVEAGPHDGPPLVLLHGLGEQGARDFDPILLDLTMRYRVLAFDLPGLARSSHQDDVYSPKRYTALVSAMVTRHFGARAVAVLGHSMGGALAIQLAADHPEQVERLMLLDVAGVLHYREYMREVIAGSAQSTWQRTLAGARKTLFAVGMFPARKMKLERLALEASPTLRGFFSSSRTAAILFVQQDFGPAIRRVRAPTFLGWGVQDSVAPRRTAMILRSQLPVQRYVEFARSGHVPMRTEPEAVSAALIAFMDAPPVDVPRPERPSFVERNGICERRSNRIFEGDYDTITLHRCKGVVLRHVRARELVIDRSEVVLEDVELESLGAAATLRRSRLRWSGGRIAADVCIVTDGSAIDLGGVQCTFRKESIQVLQPTRILASASVLRNQSETLLHGEYDLFRTRKGALQELRPLHDGHYTQYSRSTLSAQDLAGEWLVGEDLRGADLRGADLSEANLRGCDLRAADLTDADLSETLLEDARFDRDTKFPAGFAPREHGMVER